VKSELADRFKSFSVRKVWSCSMTSMCSEPATRRHATLGQISPAVFERRHAAA
jgi:hypothetical protein